MIRLVALAAVDSLQKYLSDGATPVPSFTAAQLLDRVAQQAAAHAATTAQLGDANARVNRLHEQVTALAIEKERLERALAIEQRQSEERLARLLAAESKAMEADRLLKAAAADASSVRSGRDAALDERDRARKETDAIRANLNALKDLAKAVVGSTASPHESTEEAALRKWIADYEEIPF